jgi:hypothetical protein
VGVGRPERVEKLGQAPHNIVVCRQIGWQVRSQSHFSTDASTVGYPGSTLLGDDLEQRRHRESFGGRNAKFKWWESAGDYY